MPVRPSVPDAYDLPNVMNCWMYDDEASWNAHVWTAPDAPQSVAVFDHLDQIVVKIIDDRVQGFCNYVTLTEINTDDNAARSAEIVQGIEEATAWMETTAPGTWTHPDVIEAVFDTPPGYDLKHYYLEQREVIIYYHRQGASDSTRLTGAGTPDTPNPTPETYSYLVVKAWRRSGNATVALSPWQYAHDAELVEVRDPPDECGLEIALTMARDYAAEATGEEPDGFAVGQADLTAWSQ